MPTNCPHLLRFAWRVVHGFLVGNRGVILTGAVAFNLMLSLVPLCAVLLTILSGFVDHQRLMGTLSAEVSLVAPALAQPLSDALEGFFANRSVAGWLGALSLLFFSSKAFRVLELCFRSIFDRPDESFRRNWWTAALIPYLFILIAAAGLLAITSLSSLVDTCARLGLQPDWLDRFPAARHALLVHLLGTAGMIPVFTLLYKVMPPVRVPFRRALAGGIVAALLWEAARHLLVTWVIRAPIVNAVYGSLASAIVAMLSLEFAALVLLLGARVIADLQHHAEKGLPWHGCA